jgi:hypothetical protein
MIDNKGRLFILAALFVSLSLLTFATISVIAEEEESPNQQSFPFSGAKAIYSVEGTSPLGHLIGTLTYTVKEVTESSYSVQITTEGNISKIPNVVDGDKRKLERSEPLSFSGVIEKSDLVSEKVLEIEDREIKVNKYLLETEKEFGREKITIFIPEKVLVPLIITYRYEDRFNVTIELDKTNVRYLQ